AKVHPLFMIASVAKILEGLVLTCKNVGGWTRKLYEMVNVAGYGSEDRAMRTGGPGHSVFTNYSTAAFVVGMTSILYPLGVRTGLLCDELDGVRRVKVTELAWSIQGPCTLTFYTALVQQSIYMPL
ncbi:hypothetical protein BKA83DRAFT_4004574, partial [Pisolithus microcarpus]